MTKELFLDILGDDMKVFRENANRGRNAAKEPVGRKVTI
jgi:hypothetical protein